MLAEIVAFYGFQFTDFLTTTFGLRAGASEANGYPGPGRLTTIENYIRNMRNEKYEISY